MIDVLKVKGPYEYTFQDGSGMNSYPFYGEITVYGGGGYVVPLKGDRKAIFAKIQELKNGGWIDKFTRAIFLEFTIYNANVSLSFTIGCQVILFQY